RERPRDLHNPEVTLVRVTVDEAVRIANELVERLCESIAPVRLVVPADGMSLGGSPGGALRDSACDAVFTQTCLEADAGGIEPEVVDAAINAEPVAAVVIEAFDAVTRVEQPAVS